jgi:hypothetical protein
MLDRLNWRRWIPYQIALWPILFGIMVGVLLVAMGSTMDKALFTALGGVAFGLTGLYAFCTLVWYCCVSLATAAMLAAEEALLRLAPKI